MAGEQTFMRSAKTIGGIKSFKTNVEAYDRWVFSRLFQAKFVEGMLAMTGFTDDSSTKKYLYSIISDYFINPFSNDLEPTMLFNIASGSPTSSEISKCLLQFFENGNILYDEFTSRFTSGKKELKNYWDPIKKQDWKDFSYTHKRSKVKTTNGKVVEVSVQRDMLGFLLTKSQQLGSPIDINEALKYPLSPVPLSLAHADGERRKTNKSSLYDYAISSSQTTCSPNEINDGKKAYILDLAAIMRSITKTPDTFEALSLKVLNDIPKCYKLIYVACDTYCDDSIKSLERKKRGSSPKFLIRSGKVRIPSNFQKFLCNGENKERLFSLMEEVWIEHKELIGNRTVFVARGKQGTKITFDSFEMIMELETNHEEADTKIAYLTQHALMNNDVNEVCVRSSSGDIDILVIMIGIFGCSNNYIVVDNGTGKSRRKIRIDSSTLSERHQKALVGFHAFTGNDYVSSFMRKTKKLWKKVDGDEFMIDFFCKLGNENLTNDLYKNAEKCVCKLYGNNLLENVNDLRSKLYWNFVKKNGKVPDLSLLPPCSSSLKKHTARSHYIASIWKKAFIPYQNIDTFSNFGWFPDGKIDWIDRAYPENVELLFSEKNSQETSDEQDCEDEEDDEDSDYDDEDDDDEEDDIET